MNCPYCNNPAEWVSNAEVYGRPYGKSWMMYLCRPCDARVGCHQNSQTPLGTMANKELRGWRIKAHDAIDPIWKSRQMERQAVYEWLSKQMGFPVHIGSADIALCRQIIAFADRLQRELWAEENAQLEHNGWADGHPMDYGDS